jgi:hypothetical protein
MHEQHADALPGVGGPGRATPSWTVRPSAPYCSGTWSDAHSSQDASEQGANTSPACGSAGSAGCASTAGALASAIVRARDRQARVHARAGIRQGVFSVIRFGSISSHRRATRAPSRGQYGPTGEGFGRRGQEQGGKGSARAGH